MDIESEICRSCGAAGGWSHVCEGIQLGEDGEVDPHLLDLFPALDSVATPSAQPTRQKNRSEISLIHEIERSEMIDREIRISMMERDTQQKKKISKEKKERAEDYNELWEWFSTIKDRWVWIANSTLSQLTDSSNPTRLRKPKGWPREAKLHGNFLWTQFIPPEIWRHVAESTARVLESPEGQRGPPPAVPYESPPPAVPYESPEEIERLCMASLTHSTFHSSYPANTYFKGQARPGDARHSSPADLGRARRFGLSYNRFFELRNNISFDHEVVATILSNAASDLPRSNLPPTSSTTVPEHTTTSSLTVTRFRSNERLLSEKERGSTYLSSASSQNSTGTIFSFKHSF